MIRVTDIEFKEIKNLLITLDIKFCPIFNQRIKRKYVCDYIFNEYFKCK